MLGGGQFASGLVGGEGSQPLSRPGRDGRGEALSAQRLGGFHFRAQGRVPRKHVERIVREDQEMREHKLGAWIGNQRSRAATLTPERMEQLSAIEMRWS
ncbi:helicase associated domain-containing protein [Streptomyces sp. NPDC058255]|uniref:helicase associated domain-containing protein n=1 Tax=Streptomyces sp. NPDC058255 TaxID=3346407 RepID=UPI0036EF51B1